MPCNDCSDRIILPQQEHGEWNAEVVELRRKVLALEHERDQLLESVEFSDRMCAALQDHLDHALELSAERQDRLAVALDRLGIAELAERHADDEHWWYSLFLKAARQRAEKAEEERDKLLQSATEMAAQRDEARSSANEWRRLCEQASAQATEAIQQRERAREDAARLRGWTCKQERGGA